MSAVDRLNLTDDLKSILKGDTVAVYLMKQTSEVPMFSDSGTVFLAGKEYGFSPEVLNHMLEYELLFDEAKNPKNRLGRGEIMEERTAVGFAHLERCSDAVTMDLDIESQDGLEIIKDCKWRGDGCTMCLSSASLMSQWLIGKEVKVAIEQAKAFAGMLTGQGFQNVAEELLVFEPIKENPMKCECLLVPWRAFEACMEFRK